MINRFSSRGQRMDRSFLAARLHHAQSYDRIAGYFSSSLLEVVGEELESVQGRIRMVCNSDLAPEDVQVAQAAVKRSWTSSLPENLLEGSGAATARQRFQRLYDLLVSGKLEVRVLPDQVFGLIHGKAGVITLADGSRVAFMGSANESRSAWQLNYELVWEDTTPQGVAWVQQEFEALWNSPYAMPLAQAMVTDLRRLAGRQVIALEDWQQPGIAPNPAAALVELPVVRQDVGLWDHQKYFVRTVFADHTGPRGKARYLLADQVGLGKTLQLALSAQLIALTGNKPILVLAPKPLLAQWQDELSEKLGFPSAVWTGKAWEDETGRVYPYHGIDQAPRRLGLVSTGLIKRKTAAAQKLLELRYDCVILDEAHHARRRNLGAGKDDQKAEPNNLLAFLQAIAPQTRTLLLATATPVQLRPIEAWDLLEALSRGDEAVLGSEHSKWRNPQKVLLQVMDNPPVPDRLEQWGWLRDPLPAKSEGNLFEKIRANLDLSDDEAVVPGSAYNQLSMPTRSLMERKFAETMMAHNPFIRRIVRRTREYLEDTLDPTTGEPYLKRIGIILHGEGEHDAVHLPTYLQEAYDKAEEFCQMLQRRLPGSGFLKTLLLRRVGSSVQAGMQTVQRMLDSWQTIEETPEDDELDDESSAEGAITSLTPAERQQLEATLTALRANQERDPKHLEVRRYLLESGWLERGCIVFSQYRDTINSLADYLSAELPHEPIGIYSGVASSGLMQGGFFSSQPRETLKEAVRRGQLRLLLGTDAASEGLNLQRLGCLINLDLPWNPTRLEQRKGRIQRIGQLNDTIEICNLRYRGSVEDRVHQLLSTRMRDIYTLFGQLPDVLEDVWVKVALGQQKEALEVIDAVPQKHPFVQRYTEIQPVIWEDCQQVLDRRERERVLLAGWEE